MSVNNSIKSGVSKNIGREENVTYTKEATFLLFVAGMLRKEKDPIYHHVYVRKGTRLQNRLVLNNKPIEER